MAQTKTPDEAVGAVASDERPVKNVFQVLGPGLVTGASDDDPSGIGTYSQVGAQFGFGMLWVMLFSYPLMCAIQEISARIGRTTGRGIASNLRRNYSPWLGYPVVFMMLAANILNIGADIGAMGASLKLIIGGPALVWAGLFAVACMTLPALISYAKYAGILKWLTIVLFAYVATAFTVHIPWSDALRHTVVPAITWNPAYLAALVAVLGTTISPYLFFWQASQESEEVRDNDEEKALKQAPEQAPRELRRIRIDTYLGMFFSNAVAFFIILCAAVTLHAHGKTDIDSAQSAAEALRPLAGDFAFLLFAGGIVGTGLLAVPVLAGSAAYGLGELLGWRVGLDYTPTRAKGFYLILAVATLIGLGINFTPINPIKALVWSAILNGIVSVPVMFCMMLMIRNDKVMGSIAPRGRYLYWFGWLGTLVMLLAVIGMFVTLAM